MNSEEHATPRSLGLRHLALWIPDARFDATLRFYLEGMGMRVDWRPDPDNVYLTSGFDNLALHRVAEGGPRRVEQATSPLDHLGFCVPAAEDVQAWWTRLSAQAEALGVELLAAPKLHRDGATSFYLRDPAGHVVQIIHVPSIQR
ncbi:MAG: VOC family protein [Nannocystaceae bacterium]